MGWLWQDSRHSQGNQETSFAKEVITHTSYMPTKRRDNYTIKFLAKVSLSLSRLGYGLAARFCLWFGIKVLHKKQKCNLGPIHKKKMAIEKGEESSLVKICQWISDENNYPHEEAGVKNPEKNANVFFRWS